MQRYTLLSAAIVDKNTLMEDIFRITAGEALDIKSKAN